MSEIINLRRARKQRQRLDKELEAQQNRQLHGRTKAERKQDEATRELAAARLDAHRLKDD
ncbi:hypothetical protein GCM10007989_02970 [Devosia pacifica]|uniref:DUF4169 domain-containing protein n=1 Tax=Devosia pacifica TaxID=1335967 RepID=A0A918RTE6_9HYPH|nr:DUF4169 family protein [Devosia pacifica]GHA12002.1 hypothetical protein GCM10007989_02970 [Devosia pacifica]